MSNGIEDAEEKAAVEKECICYDQYGWLRCLYCNDRRTSSPDSDDPCLRCVTGTGLDLGWYRISNPICPKHQGEEDPNRPRILTDFLKKTLADQGLNLDDIE